MSVLGLITMYGFLHVFADFFLQSDWMATNKSTKEGPLILHCLIYSFIMTLAFIIPFGAFKFDFLATMCLSHYLIDGYSSKFTSYFWKSKKRHKFFCTIGVDQYLHLLVMIAYLYFNGVR